MIFRENIIKVEDIFIEKVLEVDGIKTVFKDAIFFDLEHYVYKKPICIGVFGCCYYDEKENQLVVNQYMIENKKDSLEILKLAEKYFIDKKKENNKKYLVTFSGNNDYVVIKHLFNKNHIDLDIKSCFKEVDLQKHYEYAQGVCIGLKKLEKMFEIERKSEVISGSNLAKTFSKIIRDPDYIERMSQEKIKNILLYNEQDVVSLFYMVINWTKYVSYLTDDEKAKLKSDKRSQN